MLPNTKSLLPAPAKPRPYRGEGAPGLPERSNQNFVSRSNICRSSSKVPARLVNMWLQHKRTFHTQTNVPSKRHGSMKHFVLKKYCE